MDREQARFILQSLRPDGTDEESADFEEALGVASEDAALGAWLSAERKRDAAIAATFEDIPVPASLPEDILAAVRLEKGSRASSEDLAADQAGLREVRSPVQVGASDEKQMTVLKVEVAGRASGLTSPGYSLDYTSSGERKEGMMKVVLLTGLLVVGAFAAFELTSSYPDSMASGREPMTLQALGREALVVVSQELPFELQGNGLYGYQDWIRAEGGPRFDFMALPRKISGGQLLGCRVSTVGEARAAHLCFEVENVPVHVFVVPTMPVKDAPSGWRVAADCWTCPETGVAVVAQRLESRIWFFLSEHEEQVLTDLVRATGP